jgi:NAD(P)-dependent dehydrogenase (short-subunit alcohol dehydrogenase family)
VQTESSFVITGGGRGIGRAIVERLLTPEHPVTDGRGGDVVAIVEFDAEALAWVDEHPARARIRPVIGDAADETVAAQAIRDAAAAAPLRGWINNAAIFRDAWLHDAPAGEVLGLIGRNLGPAVVGCAAAVRHFLETASGGSIVNISSHQAQRPVRGAFAYATAKAAVEGLTRALAVDYGPSGVRVNAVALGSIATERSAEFRAGLDEAERARFDREIRLLQPLGRMGLAAEVADVVAFLLSDQSRFVSGAIIPIDGGRSAVGRDPEEA